MDNMEQQEVVTPNKPLTPEEQMYALIWQYYKATFSTMVMFMFFAFVPFVKFSQTVIGYLVFKVAVLTIPTLLIAVFLMFLFTKRNPIGFDNKDEELALDVDETEGEVVVDEPIVESDEQTEYEVVTEEIVTFDSEL